MGGFAKQLHSVWLFAGRPVQLVAYCSDIGQRLGDPAKHWVLLRMEPSEEGKPLKGKKKAELCSTVHSLERVIDNTAISKARFSCFLSSITAILGVKAVPVAAGSWGRLGMGSSAGVGDSHVRESGGGREGICTIPGAKGEHFLHHRWA